jgi:glyoxylase-like metal-dependent hydrolase (beta-lactamase superfamily II)
VSAHSKQGNGGIVRSSRLTRCRLAPNPGPMSLDGTNSYLIGAPGSAGVAVVDPGPLDEPHLQALAEAGGVELVLITHHHIDHTEASARFHDLTGAPVRALDPAFCHGGGPLSDGEELDAAGVRIRVLATPGHTADSVCLHLPEDGPSGSVLTGDTILGRGPVLPDLAAICAKYLAHRHERLEQVRAALERLGEDATVQAVTDYVYTDVDASVRGAAESSVAAQLDFLRS